MARDDDPTRVMRPDDRRPTGGREPGDDRKRAFGLGFLAAVVLAGGVIAGIVIANGSGDDTSRTVTQTATSTQTVTTPTQTTATATTPTQTQTTTGPSSPTTIDQQTAKKTAQDAASASAKSGGIAIEPSEFDARCTAQGGGSQAGVWSCQVASASGQCAGDVEVTAQDGGVAKATRNDVSCGE
jgi:uncharacterized iron-regulated membrane protein